MFYKLNGVIKKAGGGGGQTVVENIPEEFKPYIENVMKTAEGKYQEGALSNVAEKTRSQEVAFKEGAELIGGATSRGQAILEDQQTRLGERAVTGGRKELMESAAYEAAKERAGLDRKAGAGGVLGSARSGIGNKAMEAEMLSKANQQVFANQMAADKSLGESAGQRLKMAESGVSTLAGLGAKERAIDQEGADKEWTGIQRVASAVYGTPIRQQAVQGGK